METRVQPVKTYTHQPRDDGFPISFGANFHDDPLMRDTQRKSHNLGLEHLDRNYAPHTEYEYTGRATGDKTWWGYNTTSSAMYGSSQMTTAADENPPPNFPVINLLAYFNETVSESKDETRRVRKVGIKFYTEDNSISIMEAKQDNSGIVQGLILSRRQVPRDRENVNDIFTLDDFVVGKSVIIYDQEYHLVDIDPASRRYLKDALGKEIPNAVGWPIGDDVYNEKQTERRNRCPKRQIPTSDMDHKRVTEQLLTGIITKHPPDAVASAQQFFQNRINEHLTFGAIWDDRKNISGDLRYCTIHYFLENDTVEIIERRQDNCGREGSGKLLCRQRVPKPGVDLMEKRAQEDTFGVVLKRDFLEASDFKIGVTYTIHGRKFLVYDADEFTREYFKNTLNTDLGPAHDITAVTISDMSPPVIHYPPPHNGFGPENNTQNWSTLSLKPPRIDVAKLEREDGNVMRFLAELVQPIVPSDTGRQFVISFHRATDEVEISERFVRNSGYIAGRFLAKGKHMKVLRGGRKVLFSPDDFKVGGTIDINGRGFKLLHLDMRSQRLLDGTPEKVLEERVRELLVMLKRQLNTRFLVAHEAYRTLAPEGTLTIKELINFLRGTSCRVSEEEAIYVLQNIAPDGSGIVTYDFFLKLFNTGNSESLDGTSLGTHLNMTQDDTFMDTARQATDRNLLKRLRSQLLSKLVQRRGTAQETFRLLAGHNAVSRMNRAAFREALNELLHFNVSQKEEDLLVGLLFDGREDADGNITFKQYQEFTDNDML